MTASAVMACQAPSSVLQHSGELMEKGRTSRRSGKTCSLTDQNAGRLQTRGAGRFSQGTGSVQQLRLSLILHEEPWAQ